MSDQFHMADQGLSWLDDCNAPPEEEYANAAYCALCYLMTVTKDADERKFIKETAISLCNGYLDAIVMSRYDQLKTLVLTAAHAYKNDRKEEVYPESIWAMEDLIELLEAKD